MDIPSIKYFHFLSFVRENWNPLISLITQEHNDPASKPIASETIQWNPMDNCGPPNCPYVKHLYLKHNNEYLEVNSYCAISVLGSDCNVTYSFDIRLRQGLNFSFSTYTVDSSDTFSFLDFNSSINSNKLNEISIEIIKLLKKYMRFMPY